MDALLYKSIIVYDSAWISTMKTDVTGATLVMTSNETKLPISAKKILISHVEVNSNAKKIEVNFH